MAKQIIKDTRQAIPGTGVTRAAANTGLLVTFSHNAAPPQPVDFPIEADITTGATSIIQGVFLDYHSTASAEIGTKGVFRIAAASTPATGHVGRGILAAANGEATQTAKAQGNIATGTIVDIDIANEFYYVDLNLPT